MLIGPSWGKEDACPDRAHEGQVVGYQSPNSTQRGMVLGCCPCFKGCSHGTSWAGECSGPVPGTQTSALTSISSSASLLSTSLRFMLWWCWCFKKIPRCFKSLFTFYFLSLECLYSVSPPGKLLLILQNPAQTSLSPGSSLASFPGDFVTLLFTQHASIFAVISFVFLQ